MREFRGVVNKSVGFEQKAYIRAVWKMNHSSLVEGFDSTSLESLVFLKHCFSTTGMSIYKPLSGKESDKTVRLN